MATSNMTMSKHGIVCFTSHIQNAVLVKENYRYLDLVKWGEYFNKMENSMAILFQVRLHRKNFQLPRKYWLK